MGAAMRWDAQAYAQSLRKDDARIVGAAQRGLERVVPSCPDWTMADLVFHVGWVTSFWGQIAAGRLMQPGDVSFPERPEDGELLDWFQGTTDSFTNVLEEANPSDEVWSWSAQKDVAFVQRRMAHEVAVHAWDAVGAVGAVEPVDADLAVDGIDEYIDLFMPVWVRQPVDPGPYSVLLRASDRPARWWLEVRNGELSTSHGDLAADAVVVGSVSELLLTLWGRTDLASARVEGERTALERLIDRTIIN